MLRTLLVILVAGTALAETVPHNRVTKTTPVNTNLVGAAIGEGLSLTNGMLSATGGGGGGGISTNDVRAIIEADAGPTNRIVRADDDGTVEVNMFKAAGGAFRAGGSMAFYQPGGGDSVDPEYEAANRGMVAEVVAAATNGMVRKTGDFMTGPLTFNDGTATDPQSAFPVTVSGAADGNGTGGLRWKSDGEFNGHFAPVAGLFWEFYFRNRWFQLPFSKGGVTNTAPAEIAVMKDLEDAGLTNALGSAAYKDANEFATAADEALVYQLLMGSNVVAEVTNYNSRVRAPQLRILQLDHDTREYFTVWTETNGLARTLAEAKAHTDAATNTLGLAKADRAWSHSTSGLGADAPAGTTWISTPETVIAGGYEYERHVTTHGEVWVLTSNGMGFGGDSNSYFRVSTPDGETLFSIEKTDEQIVGVLTDGITISGGVVTLDVGVTTYNGQAPICMAAQSVSGPWSDLSEGRPAWISSVATNGVNGAWSFELESEASTAFFYFLVRQPGATVIKNSAQTDLSGGILVEGTRFYPHKSGSTLTWTTMP